ncbi:MAG: electron transfer flavoprotein subunit alpha/FixB family protein [Desulfobacterales bacterium]|nr:electron transfer flavoprotein subunit alpha/FixB family protein [Desulfobacterales bacterium]MBF0395587.1 electron transfer flavoprotein subunit alpha/FixB family protein [Desulfobacterales bacterium]
MLLIGETIENKLSKSSFDLITFIRDIAIINLAKTIMIIPGKDVRTVSEKINQKEGIDTLALEHDSLMYPNPLLLAKALISVISKKLPAYICLSHNMLNCQIAGILAHHLSVPCISAVESFSESDDGDIIFRRSIFNGKLKAEIKPQHIETVIITIISNIPSNPSPIKEFDNRAKVMIEKVYAQENNFIPINIKKREDNDRSLEEAEVIVSAGKGIGKAENISLIQDTASIFNHSTIGASRVVCDLGWLPYSKQIGETGKKVNPQLYLACGISGSTQHLAGIKDAKMIIAINSDPQAVIFNIAQYGIIEDLKTFLPILIKKYQESLK